MELKGSKTEKNLMGLWLVSNKGSFKRIFC